MIRRGSHCRDKESSAVTARTSSCQVRPSTTYHRSPFARRMLKRSAPEEAQSEVQPQPGAQPEPQPEVQLGAQPRVVQPLSRSQYAYLTPAPGERFSVAGANAAGQPPTVNDLYAFIPTSPFNKDIKEEQLIADALATKDFVAPLLVGQALNLNDHICRPLRGHVAASEHAQLHAEIWGQPDNLDWDGISIRNLNERLFFFPEYWYIAHRANDVLLQRGNRTPTMDGSGSLVHRHPGAIIIGSPGIGKTSFLRMYLLIALSLKQPILSYERNRLFLHTSRGCYMIPKSNHRGVVYDVSLANVVLLADLDYTNKQDSLALYKDIPTRVVGVSSPKEARYATLIKKEEMVRVAMDIPARDTLFTFYRHRLGLDKLTPGAFGRYGSREKMEDAFLKYLFYGICAAGFSPCDLNLVFESFLEDTANLNGLTTAVRGIKEDIELALDALTPNNLSRLSKEDIKQTLFMSRRRRAGTPTPQGDRLIDLPRSKMASLWLEKEIQDDQLRYSQQFSTSSDSHWRNALPKSWTYVVVAIEYLQSKEMSVRLFNEEEADPMPSKRPRPKPLPSGTTTTVLHGKDLAQTGPAPIALAGLAARAWRSSSTMPLQTNVLYVSERTNQVSLDAFILCESVREPAEIAMVVFQIASGQPHEVKATGQEECIALWEQYKNANPGRRLRSEILFIFVVPALARFRTTGPRIVTQLNCTFRFGILEFPYLRPVQPDDNVFEEMDTENPLPPNTSGIHSDLRWLDVSL
ncbi:hypothetical protein MKEN_01283500 [Mycena kentingensis (nom. inval.)]|nr:hypothetical protein MKEN_01283500 [Mycena kentingensis (nom. inval.)]